MSRGPSTHISTLLLSSHFSLISRSAYARHCLMTRGLLPFLSTPSQTGEALLAAAIANAASKGLVHPGDHVVVVQRVGEDFCVKIVSVDAQGVVRAGEGLARGRVKVAGAG